MSILEYKYIDTEEKLKDYYTYLKENYIETISVDFEYESNLHEYGEKLCVVQIFDGKNSVIIDPLKVPITQIKKIMENRTILKIMFGAAGDRAFLYKNCKIDILSILDLQTAVLLLDYPKHDLLSVLKESLKIVADISKKKFQRHNWNTRPINPAALQYALMDVIYLFKLKNNLFKEIVARNLLDSFFLKNLQAQNKPHNYDKTPKLLKSREFDSLSEYSQDKYTKLFYIRDRYAKKLNLPPNSVIVNSLLSKIVEEEITIDRITFGNRVNKKFIEILKKEINKIL